MSLGKRINALRRDLKLSQEYVAEKLNVSRQAVSKWENDLSSPDTENLIALAELLKVDVEFLATGQITEDMEPEPVPVPADVPHPGKMPRDRKKLLVIFLCLSLLANLVLACLWQGEKNSEELLELLCVSAVSQAKEHFADFVHHGSDASYWKGVADFRCFMQGYALLCGTDGDYLECNELYGNFLFEKDKVILHMEDVRKVMRLLSENPGDWSGFLAMDNLNNLIRHGP